LNIEIDKWSGERQHRARHPHSHHACDQTFGVEEGPIKPVAQCPNIERDILAARRIEADRIGRGLFDKPHKRFRNMVDMNIDYHRFLLLKAEISGFQT
jgi:hypothetical protein